MLPVYSDFCHGDNVSLGVSSKHWFTVFPRYAHVYVVNSFIRTLTELVLRIGKIFMNDH